MVLWYWNLLHLLCLESSVLIPNSLKGSLLMKISALFMPRIFFSVNFQIYLSWTLWMCNIFLDWKKMWNLHSKQICFFSCRFYFNFCNRKNFKFFSWAKDMNVISCFFEAFTNAGTPSKFLRLSVCLYFCFVHFTLLVYKSLIMVVENFQKYHWIQHKNAQPLVLVTKRQKLLWTSEASESLFNWHIHFICIEIFNNRRRKFPKIPLDSV